MFVIDYIVKKPTDSECIMKVENKIIQTLAKGFNFGVVIRKFNVNFTVLPFVSICFTFIPVKKLTESDFVENFKYPRSKITHIHGNGWCFKHILQWIR